ncbi:MAG: selenocysteine-specific translation elongation factor [Phycisphaerales bacterium]|nr:MAG: selenocysteine-specific translation elongation factor [Phycisphaerales bacterium]
MSPGKTQEDDTTAGDTRHFILGTAGHIDHGKTLLVKALTGVDTDRLPEERRRGMTIELGFAELIIGSARFGVVDVPGHERFVRMMVAGATGIDLALIVVAADDSVMPQTVEHIEVLKLLGVRRAVVAITKIDLVDPDMVELVTEDVRNQLADTPLQDAPIRPVSSTTGVGVEELGRTILEVAEGIDPRPTKRPFRVAMDRVFTVKGRGTVVTGSVLRGVVESGDTLEVWPSGDTCRVRGLQTHGVSGETLACGQRAAINISGVDRERISRGAELATPGYLQATRMMDVELEYLSTCEHPLKSTSIARLGIGTVEVPARVVLYEASHLEPGASTFAQLRCGESVAATYGQRFILRDESATRTIGGGVVLRAQARRRRRHVETELEILRTMHVGDAIDRVEQVLRVAGFVAPTDLQVVARAGVELDELPGIYEQLKVEKRWVLVTGTDVHVVPAAIEDLERRLVNWLERYHKSHPDAPGRHSDAVLGWLGRLVNPSLARPLFDEFIKRKAIKTLGSFTCLPAFAPELTGADEKLMAAMLQEIRSGMFQPPLLDGLSVAAKADRKRWQRLATLAVALGELVQIDSNMYLHTETERELRERVAELIRQRGGVAVADVREALQSSRKYVVPFMEHLDRVGFTQRRGDARVLAPETAP